MRKAPQNGGFIILSCTFIDNMVKSKEAHAASCIIRQYDVVERISGRISEDLVLALLFILATHSETVAYRTSVLKFNK